MTQVQAQAVANAAIGAGFTCTTKHIAATETVPEYWETLVFSPKYNIPVAGIAAFILALGVGANVRQVLLS